MFSGLVGLFVQACAVNPTYAPVTTSGQDLSHPVRAEPSKPGAIAPIPQNSGISVESPSLQIDPLAKSGLPTGLPHHKRSQGQRFRAKGQKSAAIVAVKAKPGQHHTVKKGETLFAISRQTGYGQQQLATWNHLSVPYTVAVGQKLKLFGEPPSADKDNRSARKGAMPEQDGFEDKNISSSSVGFIQPAALRKPKKTQLVGNMVKLSKPKTATISVDKQKMLKLAFGWPIKGVVVKNFRQSKNKGIDIAGKIGQTVYAAESGRVIYGGPWLVGFGSLLIIKHDPVYLSAYANNSQLLVKEGQKVSKGQVVAQVGRTPSRKAALHFEIRKNGKSVNPLKFLPNL